MLLLLNRLYDLNMALLLIFNVHDKSQLAMITCLCFKYLWWLQMGSVQMRFKPLATNVPGKPKSNSK